MAIEGEGLPTDEEMIQYLINKRTICQRDHMHVNAYAAYECDKTPKIIGIRTRKAIKDNDNDT